MRKRCLLAKRTVEKQQKNLPKFFAAEEIRLNCYIS